MAKKKALSKTKASTIKAKTSPKAKKAESSKKPQRKKSSLPSSQKTVASTKSKTLKVLMKKKTSKIPKKSSTKKEKACPKTKSKTQSSQGHKKGSKKTRTKETPTTNNNEYIIVMNALPYQATREAIYKNTFRKIEEAPWPTALFGKKGEEGHAQLRPLIADDDNHLFMPPEELAHWSDLMWKQSGELSDLDADILDGLNALWLSQAKTPEDDAVADINELLIMRGLQPKKGGQGRKGGFRIQQKRTVLRALTHIQNLWINMFKVKVYKTDKKSTAQPKPSTHAIQSRAFVITDRMGQLRLDGSINIQKFIFRPGKVFAHFLFGPGRQTALLAAKALNYDPYRQKWEKRLVRYLSWEWRTQANNGSFSKPYTIEMLIEAIGEPLNKRYPTKTKERLEKALNILKEDNVIVQWKYLTWKNEMLLQKPWIEQWLKTSLHINPPQKVKEFYTNLEKQDQIKLPSVLLSNLDETFHAQIKARRKRLGFTQAQAAADLEISQGHLSRIERGKIKEEQLKENLRNRFYQWLQR